MAKKKLTKKTKNKKVAPKVKTKWPSKKAIAELIKEIRAI